MNRLCSKREKELHHRAFILGKGHFSATALHINFAMGGRIWRRSIKESCSWGGRLPGIEHRLRRFT